MIDMFSKFVTRDNSMPMKSCKSKSITANSSVETSGPSATVDDAPPKKSKGGFRRLLDRTRSTPASSPQHNTSTPSPAITAVPSRASPAWTDNASTSRNAPTLGSQVGSVNTANNNYSTSGESRRNPSPVQPPRVSGPPVPPRAPSPQTKGTTAAQSAISAIISNHPCSPLKDVIMEEEYEEPADVSRSISNEIEAATRTAAVNGGIYSEPCDAKQKKAPERTSSSRSEVTPTNYVDKIKGISRSNSSDSATIANSGMQPTTGRSSTASSDSRHTLSESPAVDLRPRPLANTPARSHSTTNPPTTAPPQGNTIISHHPASPFSPLQPRAASCTPTAVMSGAGGVIGVTPLPASGPPLVATRGVISPAPLHHASADHPPAYEEPWDMKMTRMGLDMSRVHMATGGEPPCSSSAPPVPPHAAGLARPRPTRGRAASPGFEGGLDPALGGGEGPLDITKMSQSMITAPSGRDSSTNMERSLCSPSLPHPKHPPPPAPPLHGKSSGHDNSLHEDNNTSLPGPHSTQIPHRKGSGMGTPLRDLEEEGDLQETSAAAFLTNADTDSLSTDSYDEPWDVRHGRVIRELTSARLIDPSSVIVSATLPSSGHSPAHTAPRDSPLSRGGHQPPLSAPPLPGCVGGATSTAGSSIEASDGFFRGEREASRQQARVRRSSGGGGVFPGLPTGQNSPPEIVDRSLPLDEQGWFHPEATRSTAEDVLGLHRDGSYLVRRSETNKNDFSLTIKHQQGFLHMRIARNSRGQYILGQYSQPYATVPAMIYHYSKTLLPIKGAESMTLRHPVGRLGCLI